MDNNNQYINPAMLSMDFTDHGESLPMQQMQLPPPQQVASQDGSPSLGLVSQQELQALDDCVAVLSREDWLLSEPESPSASVEQPLDAFEQPWFRDRLQAAIRAVEQQAPAEPQLLFQSLSLEWPNGNAPIDGHQFEASTPPPQSLAVGPEFTFASAHQQMHNNFVPINGYQFEAQAPSPQQLPFNAVAMPLFPDGSVDPAFQAGWNAVPAPAMQQTPSPPPLQQQLRRLGRPRTRAQSDSSNKRGRGRPRGSKDSYVRLPKGLKAQMEPGQRKEEVSRRKKRRVEEELGDQSQVLPSCASGSSLGPQGPFGPPPPPGSFGPAGPPMTWSG